MAQFLALLIIAIFAKFAWDAFQEYQAKNKNNGNVIDLSNAWVDVNEMPYRKRDYILNARELAAFRLIAEVLDSRYVVFPKVRLADLLSMPADAPRRQEYLERIKDRRVDFVICGSDTLEPVLAVFVSNNDNKKKPATDRFTLRALETAGFPYTSLDLSNLPVRDTLLADLREAGLNMCQGGV